MDGIGIDKKLCKPHTEELKAAYPEVFQILDGKPPFFVVVAVKEIDMKALLACMSICPSGIELKHNI